MLLPQAETLIAQRRYEEAYQLLHPHASDPQYAILLGQAATSTGRYGEALAAFALANQTMPSVEIAALRYAQELLIQGQQAEAQRHLADAVRRFPGSARLHYLKTRIAIDVHGVVGAGFDIRTTFSLAPTAAETTLLLEALNAIEKGAAAPKDFGSPHWNGIWQDFLFEFEHKSARFFGTSEGLLQFALGKALAKGLTLEFGVYFGRSIATLAAHTNGAVHGFDSFKGLPEAWHAGEGAGAYTTEGRLPSVPANVELHQGWFVDTVPPFMASSTEDVRLAHIDCDLYSSTMTVLEAMKPKLMPGSILVFDDFVGFPSAREHEFRAWQDFVTANHIQFEYIGFVLLDRAAAVAIR